MYLILAYLRSSNYWLDYGFKLWHLVWQLRLPLQRSIVISLPGKVLLTFKTHVHRTSKIINLSSCCRITDYPHNIINAWRRVHRGLKWQDIRQISNLLSYIQIVGELFAFVSIIIWTWNKWSFSHIVVFI